MILLLYDIIKYKVAPIGRVEARKQSHRAAFTHNSSVVTAEQAAESTEGGRGVLPVI